MSVEAGTSSGIVSVGPCPLVVLLAWSPPGDGVPLRWNMYWKTSGSSAGTSFSVTSVRKSMAKDLGQDTVHCLGACEWA